MSATGAELRERLAAGESLVGTFLNLGSPLSAEICGIAGLDWALVDFEHGSVHEADLIGQLLGAHAGGLPVFVRVETAARARIGRALDNGACGVMAPRIDTVEQARDAVRHMHYAPHGDRGVATYNRACRFGSRVEAIEQAHEQTVGIIQIESPAAVAAAPDIAALPGVDVLFVGPGDLTHAMGRFGQVEDPEFLAACRRTVAAAQAAGKAAGILVPAPARVAWALELGFTFVGVGSDSTLLLGAARQAREALSGKRA
jgi:2-keto-3-deoxy-L-rhamnonate aldolase RhmA